MDSTPIQVLLTQYIAGDLKSLFVLYDWLKEREADSRYRGAYLYLRRRIGELLQLSSPPRLRSHSLCRMHARTAAELFAYLWEACNPVPEVMALLEAKWAEAQREQQKDDIADNIDGENSMEEAG